MRIVAGKYKGQILEMPKGKDIRPTTDRVREALFSSLFDQIENAKVLDAFTGSGALGLEAISRGAESVLLCDLDTRTAETNIRKLGLSTSNNVKTKRCDSLKANFPDEYDLVFLDPPYATNENDIYNLIRNLAGKPTIIYEHDKDISIPDDIQLIKSKKYGRIRLSFLQIV